MAYWQGIQVAVKTLGEEVFTDEDKVWVGLTLLSVQYLDHAFALFQLSTVNVISNTKYKGLT